MNPVKKTEEKVAEILKTQPHRIRYNILKDYIAIDISRNRHVILTLGKLKKIQQLLDADDIHLYTPIRCKQIIKLIYHEDKRCKKNTGNH